MLVVPPPELCTDNGAMIAWAGAERLALGLTDPLDIAPRARWPLDEVAGPQHAAGACSSQQGARAHEHSTASRCSEAAPGAPRSPTSRRAPAAASRCGSTTRTTPSSSRDSARADSCRGVRIDDSIAVTRDLAEAARAQAILLVVPAQAMRAVAQALAQTIAPGTPVIACAKGIERGTHKFMTEVIAECAPKAMPAILSGPSFAADVARGLPTAVTLAAQDEALAAELAQGARPRATFRPYQSTDVRGVEIGGAAKNVLAIAAGIVTGRGLGASAAAALTTRGFAELVRFGRALRRQARDADGPVRPRRPDPDLLEPAVAQFFASASRSARAARPRTFTARPGSPKAPSPRRCCSRWRARAMSTCRSRQAVAAVLDGTNERGRGDRVAADAAVQSGGLVRWHTGC